ncbi:hypothetical protein A6035_16025 [Dietzia lutea]|uniref:Glycosyltransferase subfamily 4-like N-terminal domain-containing protein n=1 Tax=Dietzia lutea TaxID=546160 RepID=A0A2S1RCP8_9ACTN|nr:hypothetical protein A6035_16025 [Dietzia lutea]
MPAGHDYVRHALGPAADVVVLDDPVLDPAEPARWWPHPALEAAERTEVLDDADLVHVHFGYEHRSPGQIAEFVAALRARAMPLVVTVHDLTNPHEPDPAAHLERTGHLVRGASAVLTLTVGAAAEIRERWGVDAQVVPHPRLVPAAVTEPLRRERDERVRREDLAARAEHVPADGSPERVRTVGVVLGSLRAGVAAEELLPALADALPRGARLVVMVRADALAAARDPRHPRHADALVLDRLSARADIEVRAHDHLPEAALCAALAGFDALVLPHRHGTHSGWLELCRDLGLPPVVPRIGYLVEQWGHDVASYDPGSPDIAELRAALDTALGSPPVPARSPDAEDAAVAAVHAAIYRAALKLPQVADARNRRL